ncbi:E1 ubiquitin-activating protein uba2 [Knufia fluminis]|uniref:Ubiquitin-activating enzyme E1-like n=1 Tax=Knufia fluminis TaxID=191047 RepID=A0AAN8IQ19_9EURO|nr:E1 ubiquitin-activating protein uba2 [Knufia fluminis]
MPRERFQRQSLGVMYNTMKEARVLLVGAGGIGCELLKDLVKSGFGEIHIIDLDTIDLSNLNRQFLFRHEHIKKSKALVAKEVAQKFDPRAKLIAHHANIKDEQYNVEWFSGFKIVFNALDNIDARRHVNRMCLAADVPLIESGTTGFNGNVQVIKKGKTACYDCKPKQIPKSFPVCTVRSTPSQPIHTIVWAKSYLLPELFGVSEDQVAEVDSSTDSENAEEIKKLKEESQQLRKLRESMSSDDFAQQVFDQVFRKDVERLLSMEDYWKNKKAPTPLSYEIFATGAETVDASISKTDQRIWTIPETFVVFKDSLTRLSKRLAEERAQAEKTGLPEPVIEFDKDDDDTLDFVTAAANLWSAAFAIEPKSKFDTKQMAGNIIPAIATTNAMIAALCVLQAYKVMKGEFGRTREIFLQKANMVGDSSDLPNPECTVCSRTMVRVQIDLDKATVKDLVETLKKDLGYNTEFNVNIDAPQVIIYDYMEAEDDEEAAETRLGMKLSEFEVKAGTSLIVQDDEGDEPRVDLQLFVENKKSEERDAPALKIIRKDDAKIEIPRKARKPAPVTNGIDAIETSTEDQAPAAAGNKRKRALEDDATGTPAKKIQQAKSGQKGDAIELDDDGEDEGAIVLD